MTDESIPEPVGPREQVAIKAAVKRAELWAALGYPVSKPHMPQHEYDRDYRGRIWFCNETVMDQAQLALKIILCPNCIKFDARKLGIEATRFYTTIEDDVMTVFPAVGHFLCHHCGFEEYAPLKHDPRRQAQIEQERELAQIRTMSQQQIQAYFDAKMREAEARQQKMMPPGDYLREMQKRMGIGVGIGGGIGIGGIQSEEEALRRLYGKEMERMGRLVAKSPVMNPMLGPKVNKTP